MKKTKKRTIGEYSVDKRFAYCDVLSFDSCRNPSAESELDRLPTFGCANIKWQGTSWLSRASASRSYDVVCCPYTHVCTLQLRDKMNLSKKHRENLESEIAIMEQLFHENIVKLFEIQVCLVTFMSFPRDLHIYTRTQKTERHIYLVLEYCAGSSC